MSSTLAPEQPPDVERFESSRRSRVGQSIKRTAPIFIVLILLYTWISILSPLFLEPPVMLSFLKRSAPLVILTAGEVFVLVSGEFDLAIGSLITVVVVVAARLIDGDPSLTWAIIPLLFLLGGAVGLFNGFVTTKLRVPSFITTLGMLLVLRGAVFLWTGGAPSGALPENFRVFGREGIALGDNLEVPYSVIVMLVFGGFAIWLLHFTDFGRRLMAVGGNPRAAALSGVNVDRARTLAFLLSALFAVVAGILLGGFVGISSQVGEGYEFRAITAAVIGGVVLGGGTGTMGGAMAGVLTLQALFTLLNLLGLAEPLQDTAQGLIIIAAVAYAAFRARESR